MNWPRRAAFRLDSFMCCRHECTCVCRIAGSNRNMTISFKASPWSPRSPPFILIYRRLKWGLRPFWGSVKGNRHILKCPPWILDKAWVESPGASATDVCVSTLDAPDHDDGGGWQWRFLSTFKIDWHLYHRQICMRLRGTASFGYSTTRAFEAKDQS